MRFFFTPKVGFVNKDFLVLIPEVETEIRINKFLSAGITAGIRARQSSAGGKDYCAFVRVTKTTKTRHYENSI